MSDQQAENNRMAVVMMAKDVLSHPDDYTAEDLAFAQSMLDQYEEQRQKGAAS